MSTRLKKELLALTQRMEGHIEGDGWRCACGFYTDNVGLAVNHDCILDNIEEKER